MLRYSCLEARAIRGGARTSPIGREGTELTEEMENTERNAESSESSAHSIDLNHILKELNSMSTCMNDLATETQMLLCDLTVSFVHPDKLAPLRREPDGTARPEAADQSEE
ncbi:hypothetical protein MATL_G00169130 [Megalops atlanticus]|uniref:Uncharacterized protein n=1 Tax=Megalops atlanticus TaxID=7932 RepID=A0A9D3PSR8_MEGAT|nr:hypothetical protein MATL_G00169130 [Megalops atlanticus]